MVHASQFRLYHVEEARVCCAAAAGAVGRLWLRERMRRQSLGVASRTPRGQAGTVLRPSAQVPECELLMAADPE